MRLRFSFPSLRTGLFAGALSFGLALTASADETELPKSYDEYLAAHTNVCVGPLNGKQAAPTVFELNGFHYSLDGARAQVKRTSARKGQGIKLGVINAIKDTDPKTLANIDEYLSKFKDEDVDGVVIGGDTAYDEEMIDTIVQRVAGLGVPVYAIIGNAESTGSWNSALRSAVAAKKNVLNLDLTRVVNADGFDLVSLPGYFDKRYTARIAPCLYKPKDVKELSSALEGLQGPVVAISHGPPKQAGKLGIDYVPQAGNVGDPELAEFMAQTKIPFGIFGHIVEAGGRATDLQGKKEVKPATFTESLFLNPGSANSAPWRLNAGGETWGMAAVVTIDGKKAKYDIIRSKQRPE
jgi:Icc-related predicted phosphoesterase